MHSPVNARRWIVAAIACAIALTTLTGCGGEQKVPTITASQLRAGLARSGLRIDARLGHPRRADTEVVGGIAHGAHGARVEFEFVVASGRRAGTDEPGTLDIPSQRRSQPQPPPSRSARGQGRSSPRSSAACSATSPTRTTTSGYAKPRRQRPMTLYAASTRRCSGRFPRPMRKHTRSAGRHSRVPGISAQRRARP
jgi:hypothetical protein